jgi:hypothetical protein
VDKKAGATLWGAEVTFPLSDFLQLLRQRNGAFDAVFKSKGAELSHERVWVVLAGQKKEPNGARIGRERQADLQRSRCGPAACGIAVEAEHDVVSEAKELGDVLRGAGCPEGRNGVGTA